MTGDKMHRIQSRVKKLGKLFPTKPSTTPEEDIREMAVKRLSDEDLMVLRRLILSRQAGRPVLEVTERESRALEAYQLAFAQEAARAGHTLTVRSR